MEEMKQQQMPLTGPEIQPEQQNKKGE